MRDISRILPASILALLLFPVSGLLAQSSHYNSSDQAMKKELESFKVFIQEHPRALAELKKDPSLIRSSAFADEHQVVGEYLEQHAKVKEELKEVSELLRRPKGHHARGPAQISSSR